MIFMTNEWMKSDPPSITRTKNFLLIYEKGNVMISDHFHFSSSSPYLFAIIQYLHLIFQAGGFAIKIRRPFPLLCHVLGMINLTLPGRWALFAEYGNLWLEMWSWCFCRGNGTRLERKTHKLKERTKKHKKIIEESKGIDRKAKITLHMREKRKYSLKSRGKWINTRCFSKWVDNKRTSKAEERKYATSILKEGTKWIFFYTQSTLDRVMLLCFEFYEKISWNKVLLLEALRIKLKM